MRASRQLCFFLNLLSAVLAAACGSKNADPCLMTGESSLRVCAGPMVTEGVDVSVYQGTIDWSAVKAAGKVFAFARVSDGIGHPDGQFARNWTEMKAAGIIRGVYQYFRPGLDPVAQANLLLEKVAAAGGFQPGDLPPVLDIETSDGQAASTVVTRALQWLEHLEQALGRKPIVYTAAFMSNVIGSDLGGYPLWAANWGASCPLMPTGWDQWDFWQYSNTGQVPGIPVVVDLNQFNGSLSELRSWAGATDGADAGTSDGGVPADGGGMPSGPPDAGPPTAAGSSAGSGTGRCF